MDEIERNARLLCEAAGENQDEIVLAGDPPAMRPLWHGYTTIPRRLAAAGLTLARIEPDEAAVERMARAIIEKTGWDAANSIDDYRDAARAAYRAAVSRQRSRAPDG